MIHIAYDDSIKDGNIHLLQNKYNLIKIDELYYLIKKGIFYSINKKKIVDGNLK